MGQNWADKAVTDDPSTKSKQLIDIFTTVGNALSTPMIVLREAAQSVNEIIFCFKNFHIFI